MRRSKAFFGLGEESATVCPIEELDQSRCHQGGGRGEMARIGRSKYQKPNGKHILGESGDADSRFGEGQKNLEVHQGSWYMLPPSVLETSSQLVMRSRFMSYELGDQTLGEKLTSLIIRFLLHLSS